MRRLTALLAVVTAASIAAACGSAKAQVLMPDAAPLAMPAAPPHVVVPAPPEMAQISAVETPAQTTTTLPAPTGGATRPRTEPAQRATPPPATPPSAPPAPAPSAPTPLQAAPNQGELEQQARALKDAADKALERIDYKALGADARAQYDTAKRFLKQADDALKAKNIVYAWQLADKANTIATLLR